MKLRLSRYSIPVFVTRLTLALYAPWDLSPVISQLRLPGPAVVLKLPSELPQFTRYSRISSGLRSVLQRRVAPSW